MDFLDPKLHRRHTIMLYVGYACIGLAILIGTLILMKIAYGFGLGKNGEVVQNGFLYLSSTPSGAQIKLNGQLENPRTNARMSLAEGTYHAQLERQGYRSWQRDIGLEGGSVARFYYPFLFPQDLKTTRLKSYSSAPELATQSPDRRWLLIQHADDQTMFDAFDLKNVKQPMTTFQLPAGVMSLGTDSQWQAAEWSTDNQHVLLQHTYDGKTEFIMMDRTDPTQSVNLNQTLSLSPTKLTLRDKKYDQYYVYDGTAQTLSTATLDNPTPAALLDHVLSYQSYGSDILLYASSNSSGSSKVSIDLLQGGKTYSLKEVAADTTYLLNLTRYNGTWFVALGASSENKVYIYKNPVSQLNSRLGVLTPIYILKTPAPTYLSFSTNAQYIMAENNTQFAVYDAEYDKGYSYTADAALDAPQAHASWMDGNRLAYVSGSKLVVFDYDHANVQTLMPAHPAYLPFFDTSYKYVDTIIGGTGDKAIITTTPLRTAADQ